MGATILLFPMTGYIFLQPTRKRNSL